MPRRLLNPACGACDSCVDCDWNGCTKPSALVISGSSTDGLFPTVDGTYSISSYTTTISGNCAWSTLLQDSPSRRIEARVLVQYGGVNTYNVFVTLLYAKNDGSGSGFSDTTTYEYSWQLISASCPTAGTKTTTLDSTTIIGAGAGSTAPSTVQVTI